jgi:putative DNA primase/helicase
MKKQEQAQQRLNAARQQRKNKIKGVPPVPKLVLPSPSAPMQVARAFVQARCLYDGKSDLLTLRYGFGCFWIWCGTHWAEAEPHAVRAMLYDFTEHAVYLNDKLEPKEWSPNRYKIGDVVEALSAIIILPAEFEQPGWLDGRETGPIVAVNNGLLDITSRQLSPHTPMFFGQVSVPFDYDPNAPEPKKWNAFLDDLWPDDPDAIDVLGEWYGYIISGRTDLHKILMMVGPTRGGKGIIARILGALLGKRNVCGPTLSSLGGEFGLAPLLGKSLAVISDARSASLKGSSSTVVERLLSISGEDWMTVNRKYKQQYSGKIPVRFHIISNELPRLGDASGAIIGRLVLLLTKRSWLGKEDHQLEPELHKELTGILNFALDGLQRLAVDNDNHFTRFEAAEEAIITLRDLASPVGAFVREKCVLDINAEISVDLLYTTFREWSQACDYPKTPKAHFGRDLRAACPSVRKTRPRDETQRHYVYAGIRLRTPEDDEADAKASTTASRNQDSARTTRTSKGSHQGSGPSGPSGPSEKPIPVSGTDGLKNLARVRETPTYGSPLDYHGPVVETPDLGPDSLDEHGAPGVPPLTQGHARDLAEQYHGKAVEEHNTSPTGDVNSAKLDAWLRETLAAELAPEQIRAAVKQVMDLVFAM